MHSFLFNNIKKFEVQGPDSLVQFMQSDYDFQSVFFRFLDNKKKSAYMHVYSLHSLNIEYILKPRVQHIKIAYLNKFIERHTIIAISNICFAHYRILVFYLSLTQLVENIHILHACPFFLLVIICKYKYIVRN